MVFKTKCSSIIVCLHSFSQRTTSSSYFTTWPKVVCFFWDLKTLHSWRKQEEVTCSRTVRITFQILQWQSGRPGSLQFLLLFPIKKQTEPFISHCSDKEGGTEQTHAAPLGALALDVWSADLDTSLVNRKSSERQSGCAYESLFFHSTIEQSEAIY